VFPWVNEVCRQYFSIKYYSHTRVTPFSLENRLLAELLSGFGDLEVACWPLVPKFAGSNPAEVVGFLGRKNPQHAFLRRGRKAVCPMSCFTACKRTQRWRGSRHFRQNFSAISRPWFHLLLLGSLASLQTLGASCGESWNALNHCLSSNLGVWRAAANSTL
jgi:hypothetical protein